jgi:hypothetical protein
MQKYVVLSLELHLFFARIMKEHSFFLEAGMVQKDEEFIKRADEFRKEFENLLYHVVKISDGMIRPAVLDSGEIVTEFTGVAEEETEDLTGIPFDTRITELEEELRSGDYSSESPELQDAVRKINKAAIYLLDGLIELKEEILNRVLTCNMFTTNYPLMNDHIIREANHYLQMVQIIQRREDAPIIEQAYREEVFWNRIMGEHAEFQRGLLDPSENALIKKANDFAIVFEQLTKETELARGKIERLRKVTENSLKATREASRFNEQGTQGLISCKVRSIIIPLLADHVLRETNHDLRQLIAFQRGLSH